MAHEFEEQYAAFDRLGQVDKWVSGPREFKDASSRWRGGKKPWGVDVWNSPAAYRITTDPDATVVTINPGFNAVSSSKVPKTNDVIVTEQPTSYSSSRYNVVLEDVGTVVVGDGTVMEASFGPDGVESVIVDGEDVTPRYDDIPEGDVVEIVVPPSTRVTLPDGATVDCVAFDGVPEGDLRRTTWFNHETGKIVEPDFSAEGDVDVEGLTVVTDGRWHGPDGGLEVVKDPDWTLDAEGNRVDIETHEPGSPEERTPRDPSRGPTPEASDLGPRPGVTESSQPDRPSTGPDHQELSSDRPETTGPADTESSGGRRRPLATPDTDVTDDGPDARRANPGPDLDPTNLSPEIGLTPPRAPSRQAPGRDGASSLGPRTPSELFGPDRGEFRPGPGPRTGPSLFD